jgi:hypothetical protein
VDRGKDRVDETLIRVRRKIHGDLGAGRGRANDLNVE